MITFLLAIFFCCSDYDLLPNKDQGIFLGRDTSIVDTVDSSIIDSSIETGVVDSGYVDPSRPVAVCNVSPNPVQPPFESASWDGTASYDPSGLPLASYNWSLIDQPEGSSVSMMGGSAAVVNNFIPDLAGDYTGRLIVTNQDGLTDSCEVVLNAIPAQNLWVEMFWQYPDEDMDLHLIAPGENWQSAKTTDRDCYYGNCTPNAWINLDWGQPGNTSDDPSLDIDDIPGTGPENINIYNPETVGTYTVVVHDYTGSTSDVYGGNEVTVNIYLNGSLAWTDTRVITGEGSYTPFAKIDWGAGVVIPQ
jgi:hypothetical protein